MAQPSGCGFEADADLPKPLASRENSELNPAREQADSDGVGPFLNFPASILRSTSKPRSPVSAAKVSCCWAKFSRKPASEAGLEVSWLPSYGPEMRSGTSNCQVRLSRRAIDSPLVSRPIRIDRDE